MIYATDLDRTLVFSEKFLEDYPNKNVVPVEFKDDRVISYMSTRVIEALKRMKNNNDKIKFVAVTTRSITEVNRINLPIKPDYIICANGGVILGNDKISKEFEYINKKLVDLNLLENIVTELNKLECITSPARIIDGTYIFCKTNDQAKFRNATWSLREKYKADLEFTEQRMKCYIIPKGITKASTLDWLKRKTNEDFVLAVGDSELDIPMLKYADYGFTQKHGEIYKQGILPDGVSIIPGGCTSPLYTISLANKMCKTI